VTIVALAWTAALVTSAAWDRVLADDGDAVAGWPCWRADAERSATTTAAAPRDPVLRWSRALGATEPAWPDEPRLDFDLGYQPIAADGLVFVASPRNESVIALDLRSGRDVWRYFTDGPPRFAPTWADGRLFVASDDGHLHALDARTGALLWKRRGGPSGRRVLGNGRLISAWPARGAPVVVDGSVFFGAGIWPFAGVFVDALDVRDGAVRWTNSGDGALFVDQPHGSPAFGGLAPQGYLAASGDALLVPNGRAAVACLERASGALRFFEPSRNTRREDFRVAVFAAYFVHGGELSRFTDGERVASLATESIAFDHRRAYTAIREESGSRLRIACVGLRQGVDLDLDHFTAEWEEPARGVRYQVEIEDGRVRAARRFEGGASDGIELTTLGYDAASRYEDRDRIARRAGIIRFVDPPSAVARDPETERSLREVAIFRRGDRDDLRFAAESKRTVPISLARLLGIGGSRKDRSAAGAAPRAAAGSEDPAADGDPDDEDDAEAAKRRGGRDRFDARLPDVAAGAARAAGSFGDLDDPAVELPRGLTRSDRIEDEWTTTFALEDTVARARESSSAATRPVVVRAAGQLLVALERTLVAVDLPATTGGVGSGNAAPAIAWRRPLDGSPVALIVAEGRVIVSLDDGRVLAFSERDVAGESGVRAAPRDVHDARDLRAAAVDSAAVPEPIAAPVPAAARERAGDLLALAGVRSGHALVLGADVDLARALVAASDFDVVVLEPDLERLEGFRARLDALGEYGPRIVARTGDLARAGLPPWFATLVVAADARAFDAAAATSSSTADATATNVLARVLRPYGGAAIIDIDTERRAGFEGATGFEGETGLEGELRALGDPGLRIERAASRLVLRRPGALSGAGSWTHQYGDAANRNASRDSLVRAPLGLLWFGGPSNLGILPRHGHGPRPQVIGGRIVIEGVDFLRALDVYTGRRLWQTAIPGLGRAYDNTSHQPGANAIGSNYASALDAVYVAHDGRCLRLDPRDGKVIARFEIAASAIPGAGDAGANAASDARCDWGSVSVQDGALVAGLSPRSFTGADFDQSDLVGAPSDRIVAALRSLDGFVVGRKRLLESRGDFLARELNRALADPGLVRRVAATALAALRPDEAARVAAIVAEIARCDTASEIAGEPLRALHREYLHAVFPAIPATRPSQPGAKNVWDGTSSRALAAVDRHRGDLLWTHPARHGFVHNSICTGGGRVFAIDRLPSEIESRMRRRGLEVARDARVVALDLPSGAVAWTIEADVFGTFLSYSAEHDVLVESGRPSRDSLADEKGTRLVARRASTGETLWDIGAKYSGPVIVWNDRLLTQGLAYDLQSGEPSVRQNPLTGVEEIWTYSRNYGCSSAIASEHLLTFRSAAAGFFDLAGDGGTGNLGGFRSSCTQNLIVADGVLTAPDYTRSCTCSYPNQSSIGLVHDPTLELWTFNLLDVGDAPIERVGVNLGAPGDRRALDGTLWLEYPLAGGPSPAVEVKLEPADARVFRAHASSVAPAERDWVAASGVDGIRVLEVRVAPAAALLASRRYRVRLVFCEPSDVAPGERVFDVLAGDRIVVDGVDPVLDAGGARRVVEREFDADVAGVLRLELRPRSTSRLGAVISGVELRLLD